MYKALFGIIKLYWHDYGGFRELLRSPFFQISFFIAVLCQAKVIDLDWRTVAVSSLPTVLGFSLAAYTITFTLMGSALHRALSAAIDRNSGGPLIRSVNATFFHVVLFQTLALLYSLVTKGQFFWTYLGGHPGFERKRDALLYLIINCGEFTGTFLGLYAFFLLFSVGLAMFRLGRLSTLPPPQQQAPTAPANDPPAITQTWRFKLVRMVAKSLRLYD